MPDDRPFRPQAPRDRYPRAPFAGGQRPAGGPASAPRPPFPPPRPFTPAPEPQTSVRLRDGDRELDVHGSASFCRQILDELPALLARLRGETPPTAAAIALPPAPTSGMAPAATSAVAENGGGGKNAAAAVDGQGSDLEAQVLRVLRAAGRPVGIADIRRELPGGVSGQAVRRVLERADRVVNTGGRPAAYKLR